MDGNSQDFYTSSILFHDPRATMTDVEHGEARKLVVSSGNASQALEDRASEHPRWLPRFISVSRYNILLLGFAFCIVFSAFNTTQSFTTTLNKNLGFISLAVLYGTFSLCVFVAPAVESYFGPRLSIFLGAVTYALYVGASISPDIRILIPASVLIGMGASILWTGQGHFLSMNSTPDNIGLHSGIFWGFFQCNAVIGNILAASLLESGKSPATVFTILFLMACVGVLLLIFLRPAPADPSQSKSPAVKAATRPSVKVLLQSVFRLMREKQFLLLSGLFFFSGFSQAFMFGSFPPILGEEWIGWVMASLGAAEALGSFMYGRLSDIPAFGKKRCLYLASLLWAISLIFVFTNSSWSPVSFFFAGIGMGLGDSGFNTQIYAILSSVYGKRNEGDEDRSAPAFAALKFMQSISMGIGMALGIVAVPFVFCILIAALLVLAHVLFFLANRHKDVDSYRTTQA